MKRAAIYLAVMAAGAFLPGGLAAQSVNQPTVTAGSADPFAALVGKKRERSDRRTARITHEKYVLASDDRVFLFEEHAHLNEARVKFLCGPADLRLDCTLDAETQAAEIYRLQPTRGPRGDIIYKDAAGGTMLRIASYGGATVFWPGEDRGFAASKSFGDDGLLRLGFESYGTAVRRAQAATAVVSAATGAPIVFDIGAPPPGENPNASVLADAVVRAANGIKNVADDPTGARIIASRVRKVLFAPAAAPGVELDSEVLKVLYAQDGDIEGRPSSAAIALFLEETL